MSFIKLNGILDKAMELKEAEVWKQAKLELKEEKAKKTKWLNFFINKWIDAEVSLSKANATLKSDWALIAALKYSKETSKLKIDLENKIAPRRIAFWEKQDKREKDLENLRAKYKQMFNLKKPEGDHK